MKPSLSLYGRLFLTREVRCTPSSFVATVDPLWGTSVDPCLGVSFTSALSLRFWNPSGLGPISCSDSSLTHHTLSASLKLFHAVRTLACSFSPRIPTVSRLTSQRLFKPKSLNHIRNLFSPQSTYFGRLFLLVTKPFLLSRLLYRVVLYSLSEISN